MIIDIDLMLYFLPIQIYENHLQMISHSVIDIHLCLFCKYECLLGDQFNGCSRTSTPDNYLNPIQSAALRTTKSFSFKYGRVEIRAKLPR